ncbi:hypothetical protein DSLASN_24370 [Desulfoluna limicola]|uniref:Uncharacterized protein n=2 Tax=Desulfoluna limicola TaxID=2810562 RepID=A0ABN6F5E7_9BACT|nr:hypothetical protein DSLASN_24370 [Desulfoluna limicola]
MALGEEVLAEALLEQAEKNDAVYDVVERMLATPEENVARFRAKIVSIAETDRVYEWHEASGFAAQLSGLLDDIDAGVDDPCQGAELVMEFFETDKAVFERCDDSHGEVGDVYCLDARDLFLSYATLCAEKDHLASQVFDLTKRDNYGVRIALIDCAEDYLPQPIIMRLITQFRELLYTGGKSRQRDWQRCIDSLEDQLD